MKSRAIMSFVAGFALGALTGALAVKKGCPPVPVPADRDPPPVTAPASTGAAR
jgi:hypothetical protein